MLDTWFSSALWPFATLGWPDQTPQLKAFYPTDALSTARDILFLWVARMIMMGLELTGEVPFSDVYIHSIIQAPDGRRMSKSMGTGIDPIEEIDRHGADGVRFGLLAMSSTQDVRYSEEKIEQGQRLANKLFNATRFVLGATDAGVQAAIEPHTIEDRWILSRLERVKVAQAARIEGYDFSHAALSLYDFVYGELCDWYIELVKPRLADDAAEERGPLSATLIHILRETVALAHPVIPFVTEELWSHLGGEGLLAGAAYPRSHPELIDEPAEAALAQAIEAIVRVRRWRDSAGIKPGSRVSARLDADGYDATRETLARLARVELADDGDAQPKLRRVDRGARWHARGDRGRGSRPRGPGAPPRRRSRAPRRADRALAGQALQRGLRRERAARRRGRRAGQARAPASGAGDAVSWRLPDAERHLRSLELFGMRFGLERMRRLMTVLDSPQRDFDAIHVVGTNGKSSTTRMVAAILERHGIRTGAYLSPHLVSYAERVQVAERDIDADAFAAAIERAAWAAERVNHTLAEDDHVTQFEVLTAAAFWELARSNVEVAVVEAGLGGRYDATNVLDARVCALTNVGLEHTRWLGPTVSDIAVEKLAVVPSGATLVLGSGLQEEVLEQARSRARAQRSRMLVARLREPFELAAQGPFQQRNFALARLTAVTHLRAAGIEVSERAIREAAAQVHVPGRFEVVASDPLTVFDGAHNTDAALALAEAWQTRPHERPVALVFGVLEDKDAVGMLRALLPLCERAWFTAPLSPRALPPATLQSLAGQLGFTEMSCEPHPGKALHAAREWAGASNGVVLATGSVYLVGTLMSEIRDMPADAHAGDREGARLP